MIRRNRELQFSKEELLDEGNKTGWFENDLLDRGPHIRAVSDLLLTTQGNFVMTVSSPWGTGKTTFVRMWKAYLESKGCPCVLFNAWEHDFAENPFLTFIAEMHSQLRMVQGKGKKTRTVALNELKKVGKKLFPRLISLGTKGLLGVSVDVEKLLGEDFGKGLSEALSGSLEAYASDVMEKHDATKELVNKFKAELTKVVKSFGDKPLFFFVDELDRCKPTYAVELLEAVKHLFDVDGVIFILSLDREQLGHSVRAAYGDGIDADGYLRRFIDLEYRIPKPSNEAFVRQLSEYYGVSEYPIFKNKRDLDACVEFENEFIMITKDWTLRAIEKSFLRGSIMLRGIKSLADHGTTRAKVFAHYICLCEISQDAFNTLAKGDDKKQFPSLMIITMHKILILNLL
ncbi:KAP family P-loop NTPase fold protein [Pseudodesulfovibrio pelocollis]|uniref:KAP family P-loop NTPase fold protein n=1 Tax=Pseudodesulfovibrio pelocollis TaxID=3051432 RepID=UPI00255AB79C|nr:P-loop NTPase fold protein [Pseudodesulfovibrio sp. SB368]